METTDKMLEVIKKISLAKKEAKRACNQIAAYEIDRKIRKLTDELVSLYEDNANLYQKSLKEMKECEGNDDCESAHFRADDILMGFVRDLGYTELAESFDRVGKWYS